MVYCTFRNHGWVSFQGFCESYNDTHSLSKDKGNKHATSVIVHFLLNICSTSHAELNPHTVADAFYNGELESEIRLLVTTSGTVTLSDFTFRKDSDREALMEKIESIRSQSIYHHHDCTPDCKKRGKLNNFGSKRSSTIVVVKIPMCGESQNIIINYIKFVFLCCRLWYTMGHGRHLEINLSPLHASSQGTLFKT